MTFERKEDGTVPWMTGGNDKTTPSYPQRVDSRPEDRPGWDSPVRTAGENSRRDRKTKLGNKGAWRGRRWDEGGRNQCGFSKNSALKLGPAPPVQGADAPSETEIRPKRTMPDQPMPGQPS